MHPSILTLLAIPALLALYFALAKPSTPRGLFTGPIDLLKKLTRQSRLKMRSIFALALITMALIIFAASGPIKELTTPSVTADGIDITLVFDISDSMEADDYKPNRMEVAKEVLKDFIRRRKYDRIGIVLFGGDAVTKSPLTRDYDFLAHQIDDIRFRELKQGTAIGMGLLGGVSRLRNSKAKTKVIVLLTDGDSNVGTINPMTAANLARQENIKIYAIGIGQKDRVIIPIYAYDTFGRRGALIANVPSYLNPALLKHIAQITGGQAYMARDGNMLARFVNEIDALEKTPLKVNLKKETIPYYRYPLVLGALLLLMIILLLEFRFKESYAA